MIKNVVFDVGRVLFDYQPEDVVAALLPDRNDHSFFVKHFHNAPVWQELDGGIITPNEAARLVSDLHKEAVSTEIIHLIAHFHFQLPPIEPMIQLYHSLLKTHQVYLLTNFQDEPFDRLCNAYPFLEKAAGCVVSAREKCMKPDPQIYQILLQRYDLIAEETLFIDDKSENIDTAVALGIHGVVHQSCEETIEEISSILSL